MLEYDVLQSRILIVDDELPNIQLLEMALRSAGYSNLRSTTDPRKALALFRSFAPDILLLDVHMPEMSGLEVMGQVVAEAGVGTYFPILVMTGDGSASVRQRALAFGGKDFLAKPFEMTETLLRVRNLLETRHLHLKLQDHNRLLEAKVQERTRDLEEARLEVLQRLSRAAEFRDDDTGQHTQRVGQTSFFLAEQLGMDAESTQLLRLAAPLHDIGKIGVSDTILLKPGRLTPEEFRRMAEHAAIGGDILSGSRSPLLRMAEQIALTHHEAWDGSGYPSGRRGEEIPLVGRIVSVADVFDALTHERPYKKAWPINDAVAEVASLGDRKFDRRVVDAFLALIRERRLGADASQPDSR